LALLVVLGVATTVSGARAQVIASGGELVARNPSGLSTPLPVVDERLQISIDEQYATTRLVQHYENDSSDVVEGLFRFQGGAGAHVTGFAYWNGNEKIVGEVLERRVAAQLYHGTVVVRRDPGLVETKGEGSFEFRVFPIQPREKKRIELTVEQWLPRNDRVVEYRMPLAHSTAEVDIDLRDARGIGGLTSPSHRLDTTGDAKHVRVRVGAPIAGARVLVLRYEPGDRPFQLSAVVHRESAQDSFVMVTMAAPHVSSAVHKKVTLVLDTSLAAPAYALAQRVARHLVEGLRRGDRLNVVMGGERPLFSEPRMLDDGLRRQVVDRLADGRVRAGGVDDALALALEQGGKGGRHTVVLISNGRTRARELMARAGEVRNKSTRVLAVGVGDEVDGASLGRLAALTAGAFVHVANADALDASFDRLAAQVAAPIVTDVSLYADGAQLDAVYPRSQPVLYQGRELRFVARVRGSDRATVVLSGQAHERVKLRASIDLSRPSHRPWVARLWGRERVEHLLQEIAQHGETAERVSEATDLALAYNIVTPYTAFLAIPASELSSGDALTLEEARRRKRALQDAHPEAFALMSPAIAASMDAAGQPSPSEPPAADAAEVHGGGCAGCQLTPRPSTPAWLVVALAALAAARIRRHARCNPARDGRSSPASQGTRAVDRHGVDRRWGRAPRDRHRHRSQSFRQAARHGGCTCRRCARLLVAHPSRRGLSEGGSGHGSHPAAPAWRGLGPARLGARALGARAHRGGTDRGGCEGGAATAASARRERELCAF
jgi:Ca-activated chloride channel family protein